MQALLPGITAADVTAAAKALFAGPSRVILAVSPQKQGLAVPTEAELRAARRQCREGRGDGVERHRGRRRR